MSTPRLDHVLVLPSEPSHTLRFLTEVVGLRVGPRPAFRSRGWWLYASSQAVVHVALSGEIAPSGHIHHVAFRMTEPDRVRELLQQQGWRFEETLVPQTSELQMFVPVPFGPLIELVFDAVANAEAALVP